uniref:Dynein light chain Tctex-type 5 n=1 Tax=Mus musculus TaxID=10090 RepID=A0A1Y7VP38_MOUSE
MSALAKEKLFLAMKKRGSMCSPNNREFRQKEGHWRIKQFYICQSRA